MKVHNSLTKTVEEFKPITPPKVGLYSCGPTVYDYAHIGNFRTYTLSDLLVRTLLYNRYEVDFIMNITDVGHLSGDNEGDADTGIDRMEKAEARENKNAWDIATFYTEAFLKDFDRMNLVHPKLFTKATDYITEQIDLVKRLEEKGFTYKITDGIYFDTVAFEKGTGEKYGAFSEAQSLREGARVEPNPEKRNPRDFALWKFSEKPGTRHMEWESPWGVGFPGWHIECSAMSMKFLGETFDLHVGGEDHLAIHHPNEIAQSEGATGKKFVNYWLHSAFLKVDNKRMGKSMGNAYTVQDVIEKGFDPLALRYFYLLGHYRTTINFTWEALTAAQNAYTKLVDFVVNARNAKEDSRTNLSEEKLEKVNAFRAKFTDAINNDLNTPQAIAVVWEVMKSNIPDYDKYDLIINFDEVLGLNLKTKEKIEHSVEIPADIQELLSKRDKLREQKQFTEADNVRKEIEEKGYTVVDTPNGSTAQK